MRFPDTSDEEYAAKLMAPDTQARVVAALVKAGRVLPVSLERLEGIVADYICGLLSNRPPHAECSCLCCTIYVRKTQPYLWDLGSI